MMPDSVAIDGQLRRDQIELRYYLSDLCLLRVRFRGLIANQPFTPAAPSLPDQVPEIPDDADLVLYPMRHVTQHLPTLQLTERVIRYVRNQTLNHYIDLTISFDEYLKGFSPKTRYNLQRELKRLSAMADGTLECREYRAPGEMEEFHRISRQVAVKTYQEQMFDGAIPASPEFMQQLHQLAQRDCFRGFILLIKGEPVAYLCLPAVQGALVCTFLGYDPDFASWSPGKALLYLALQRVFEEKPFPYLSFGYGRGQWKEVFGRVYFARADVYFFRRTLRNMVAVYGHAAMDRCSSRLGQMLERFGVRKAVRRGFRRFFARKSAAT